MWRRIKALRVLLPKKLSWRQIVVACVAVGMMAGAFCLGLGMGSMSLAKAQQPQNGFQPLLLQPATMSDQRAPIAMIFQNIPITRQDFGDYLIQRVGPERLDLMVNSKIIEHACMNKNVVVTDEEIEAQLIEDLKAMKVGKLEDFVNVVLKRFGKSLYEYKEDVLRPKIMMTKLLADQIHVSDQEINNAFEARYGAKVQCRIVVLAAEMNHRDCLNIWEELNPEKDKDGKKFAEYAHKNPPPLAAEGGKVPPIHKFFPNELVEKEAFRLTPGKISSLIEMPDKSRVILMCDALIPPQNKKLDDDEWRKLQHEVYARKLAEAVPKALQDLRQQANVKTNLPHEEINPQAKQRINYQLAIAARSWVPQPVPGAGTITPEPASPGSASLPPAAKFGPPPK
jgi:hypothetical protein